MFGHIRDLRRAYQARLSGTPLADGTEDKHVLLKLGATARDPMVRASEGLRGKGMLFNGFDAEFVCSVQCNNPQTDIFRDEKVLRNLIRNMKEEDVYDARPADHDTNPGSCFETECHLLPISVLLDLVAALDGIDGTRSVEFGKLVTVLGNLRWTTGLYRTQ
jgi:hypothetical protein